LNPIVPAVPAALGGVALFVLPGLCALLLLPARDREALPFDERAFLAVAVSVAASSWVGLVLAEAGRFSLVTAALVLALATAGALALGRRRLSLRWPGPRGAREWLPAAAVLAVSLVLHARPTEYLMGGRDPGTYVAAMALIARTGGIAYADPTVLSIPREDVALFYRHPDNPDFSWARFMGFPLERPETGRVFPEFFHLFPAFGAYLFQAMGVKGALATPPVFGVLGTLAVFFALRRLLGPAPALLGSLLLAVNVVQVWFARYPVSEPMSQFLLFLGLLAVAHWEERGSPFFGALGGIAFGLSLLVRIDSVLVLLPLGAYLLIRRVQHELPWRRALWLAAPLGLLALHAALHGAGWSRKYLLGIATRPYWSQPPAVWLGLAALVALGAAGVHASAPRLRRLLAGRTPRLRQGLMALLVGLFLYAYFARPVLSAAAGGDGNDPARMTSSHLALAALHDLGFHRLAAHDAQALVRLGWFVTPLGLALALLGTLRALHAWSSRRLLLLLLALSYSLFFLYKVRVWNDYYFALRRFVPMVLPFALGMAAFWLVGLGARRGWRRALAGALAALLFAAYLRDTWPLRRWVDWKGGVRFVADVARRFGPQDVVVFEQRRSVHLLSLPLWAVHGVNALELARFDPDPARLRHLVESWRPRYRNVYFIHTYSTDLCGLFLERVQELSFGSHEWERAYGGKPRGPEPRGLHFRISRVVLPEELSVPALDAVDVGGSDDVQVSGFYDKEGGGDRTYRWTGRCASVFAPGLNAGGTLAVTASAGKRPPDSKPARVEASVSGLHLGSFVVGPEWAEYLLPLPRALPPGPPVLRLDVPPWRPANVLPGSRDERDLGVMVDRVAVRDGAPPGGAR
jgi:hypothetical protein